MSLANVEALKARVKECKHDIIAWEQLLAINRNTSTTVPSFRERQELFEEFLAIFPTASGYWRMYAEAAMSVNELSLVKTIFSRCLLSCLNVDLWNLYLIFIKNVNQNKGPQGIIEIKQAFDFTLDRIGQDINSGAIWLEYITFLVVPNVGTHVYKALFTDDRTAEGQEESHRLVIIRNAFKRALSVPTYHLDVIWKTYENFEKSGTNRTLARKMLEDARSRYMLAKRVFQERKKKVEDIKFNALATPPFFDQNNLNQGSQLQMWLEYLEFEKSNPQRLDVQQFAIRVSLAYDQALQCLLYYPEVWMDYAKFHMYNGGGGTIAAKKVLERARTSLKSCLILHLMYADLEELEHNIESAKSVYKELLAEIDRQNNTENAKTNLNINKNIFPGSEGTLVDQAVLVWISYMRFLRRSETIKASREFFVLVSKSPLCSWHIFVAAALLEWRAKEQQVAVRIFEKGMLMYMGCPDYVLQYINFLLGIGDIENTRAVFERALSLETCQKSQKIWEKYIQVLYEIGDIVAIQKIEDRKRNALGDTTINNLHSATSRYRFLELYPCAPGSQITHVKHALGIGNEMVNMPLIMVPPAAAAAAPTAAFTNIQPDPMRPPIINNMISPLISKNMPIHISTGCYGDDASRLLLEQQQAPIDIKIPQNLNNFLNRLPPLEGSEYPLVDPDKSLSALLTADLSTMNRSLKRQRAENSSNPDNVSHQDMRIDEEPKSKKANCSNSVNEGHQGSGTGADSKNTNSNLSNALNEENEVIDEYRLRMRRKIMAEQQQQYQLKIQKQQQEEEEEDDDDELNEEEESSDKQKNTSSSVPQQQQQQVDALNSDTAKVS